MTKRLAIISNHAYSLVNFRGPLISALIASGIEVYTLAPDFDANLRARVAQLGAKPIDYSLSRAGMNPLRDGFDLLRLRALLRKLAPEVTLAYFIKPVIYGSVASWLAGVPHRFAMIEGLGYVFTDGGTGQSPTRRLLRKAVSSIYGIALRLNRRVFFLNRDDSAQFVREGLVKSAQVMQLDGIGLDLTHFAAAAPVVQPMTFLLMARMLKEKGVYDFIDAARQVRERFPEARFVLLGPTDPNPGCIPEPELRSWVREGLVEWPGHVDDVRDWLSAASVFVLPSYREGLPRSTQEAMAMSRPVITTDAVGCRDTVQDGVNGFIVPVRDPASLAGAMLRFLDQPQLVARMGRESRRMAEERFDVHAVNALILKAMEVATR
jgi:glycosyltransferase involved in cell wall biosynthesis